MKKNFLALTAALALLATTAATAQTTPANGRMERPGQTPEQMAARENERLTKDLGLSADQAARIQQINAARQQDMQARRGQGKPADGNRADIDAQMKTDRAKYDAQYKEVLTADQYAKYTKMEAARMQNGPGRGPGGPGGDAKMKTKPSGKTKVKKSDS